MPTTLPIHSSTPAVVSTTSNPGTTAAFTPPANALLLSLAGLDTNLSPRTTTSTTVTGSTTAWTKVRDRSPGDGAVSISWARVNSSVSTTVRTQWNSASPGTTDLAIYVPVIDGAEVVQSGDVAVTGTSQTVNITRTRAGSRVLFVWASYNSTTEPTPPTGTTMVATTTSTIYGYAVFATEDLVSGTNSFAFTNVGSNTVAFSWVEVAPVVTGASVRSISTAVGIANPTFSISKPTGTAVNDVMYAFVSSDQAGGGTAPSGWTTIGTHFSGAYVSVYRRAITATESATSYTFTMAAATGYNAVIVSLIGASTTTPEDAVRVFGGSTSSSGSATAPAITTTTADAYVLRFASLYDLSGNGAIITSTPPTGHTEHADFGNSSVSCTLAGISRPTAGSVAAAAFTTSLSQANGTVSIAVRAGVATATPKTATFIESFDGSALDSTKWRVSDATPPPPQPGLTVSGGRLTVNTATTTARQYRNWESYPTKYDLTGSTYMIAIDSLGAPGASSQVGFDLAQTLRSAGTISNSVGIVLEVTASAADCQVFITRTVAGTRTDSDYTTLARSAVKFLRIREVSGTTFWEYAAAEAGPWDPITSMANPVTLTGLYPHFWWGRWDANGSDTTISIAGINESTVAGPTTQTSALTATASASASIGWTVTGTRNDPSALPGLVNRWVAADVGLANNALVSTLVARNGRVNFVQGTSGAQPTYIASSTALGGRPALRFDGTADFMTATITSDTQPHSIVTVFSPTNVTSARQLIGGSGDGFQQHILASGQPEIFAGTALTRSAALPLAPHVFVSGYSGASSFLSIDGETRLVGNAGTLASGTTVQLGKHAVLANVRFFLGDIAEVIVYDHVLTIAEQIQIDSYAQDTYGIPVPDYLAPATSVGTVTHVSTGPVLPDLSRTNSSIPAPTAMREGDTVLLHLYMEVAGTNGATPATSPPSGFTQVSFTTDPRTTADPSTAQRLYWKRLTAADLSASSFTVTHAACITNGYATLYRGAKDTNPIRVLGSSTTGSTTTGTAVPAITGTTVDDNSLITYSVSHSGTTTAFSTPTGYTKLIEPTNSSLTTFLRTQAVAGTTGSVSSTASAAGSLTGVLIAVEPQPFGPTGELDAIASATASIDSTTIERVGAPAATAAATAVIAPQVVRQPEVVSTASAGAAIGTHTIQRRAGVVATSSATPVFTPGTAGPITATGSASGSIAAGPLTKPATLTATAAATGTGSGTKSIPSDLSVTASASGAFGNITTQRRATLVATSTGTVSALPLGTASLAATSAASSVLNSTSILRLNSLAATAAASGSIVGFFIAYRPLASTASASGSITPVITPNIAITAPAGMTVSGFKGASSPWSATANAAPSVGTTTIIHTSGLLSRAATSAVIVPLLRVVAALVSTARATALQTGARVVNLKVNVTVGLSATATIAPLPERFSTVQIRVDTTGSPGTVTGMSANAAVDFFGDQSVLTLGPPARFSVNVDATGRMSFITPLVENVTVTTKVVGRLRVVQSLTTILENGLPALITAPPPLSTLTAPEPEPEPEPTPPPAPVYDRVFMNVRR